MASQKQLYSTESSAQCYIGIFWHHGTFIKVGKPTSAFHCYQKVILTLFRFHTFYTIIFPFFGWSMSHLGSHIHLLILFPPICGSFSVFFYCLWLWPMWGAPLTGRVFRRMSLHCGFSGTVLTIRLGQWVSRKKTPAVGTPSVTRPLRWRWPSSRGQGGVHRVSSL